MKVDITEQDRELIEGVKQRMLQECRETSVSAQEAAKKAEAAYRQAQMDQIRPVVGGVLGDPDQLVQNNQANLQQLVQYMLVNKIPATAENVQRVVNSCKAGLVPKPVEAIEEIKLRLENERLQGLSHDALVQESKPVPQTIRPDGYPTLNITKFNLRMLIDDPQTGKDTLKLYMRKFGANQLNEILARTE